MASIEKAPPSDIAMMIDLETLSLHPDAFITQFGFCIADTKTRTYLAPPTNMWLSADGQRHRNIDFDTVRWWMGQDPAVAKGVFELPADHPTGRDTPQSLWQVIKGFVELYPGMTIWGSPAMADLTWLTTLFGGQKPWKYNFERDMMTVYKLVDPAGTMQPPKNESAHDAAADAGWQMEYLFNLLDRLTHLEDVDFRMKGLEK